jgi:hypothetical protein
VGDWIQRIQAYAWAIVIALIATGVIKAWTQSIPNLSLALFGAGIFVASVILVGLVVNVLRGDHKPQQGAGHATPDGAPDSKGVGSGGPADLPEVVQFANAWMLPAYDKALNALLPIRNGLQEGDHRDRLLANLLQHAIIEPAAGANGSVRNRIAGTDDRPLDALIADLYEKYQWIATWIWHGIELVDQSVFAGALADWRAIDEKCLDRLREVIGLPQLASSALRSSVEQVGWGEGVRKGLSDRLASQAEGRDH